MWCKFGGQGVDRKYLLCKTLCKLKSDGFRRYAQKRACHSKEKQVLAENNLSPWNWIRTLHHSENKFHILSYIFGEILKITSSKAFPGSLDGWINRSCSYVLHLWSWKEMKNYSYVLYKGFEIQFGLRRSFCFLLTGMMFLRVCCRFHVACR